MSNETANGALIELAPSPPEVVLQRMGVIQETMKKAMSAGIHYGIIPGTERKDKQGKELAKPVLLKPGAEMLCAQFHLAPEIHTVMTVLQGDHREYKSTCTLRHITSGSVLAILSGSASTMEKKHRWRTLQRLCPECGAPQVRASKYEEGAWYCWEKKGGCGANFKAGSAEAAELHLQEAGTEENADLADVWNTCLKISEKRAMVASVLVGTGCSAVFTQDLEDQKDFEPWTKAKDVTPEKKNIPPKEIWKMSPGEMRAFENAFLLQWDMEFDGDVFRGEDYDPDCMKWCRDTWKKMENGELVIGKPGTLVKPGTKGEA